MCIINVYIYSKFVYLEKCNEHSKISIPHNVHVVNLDALYAKRMNSFTQ